MRARWVEMQPSRGGAEQRFVWESIGRTKSHEGWRVRRRSQMHESRGAQQVSKYTRRTLT